MKKFLKAVLIALSSVLVLALVMAGVWVHKERQNGPEAVRQYYALSDSLRAIDGKIGRAMNDSAAVAKELVGLRTEKATKRTADKVSRLDSRADSLDVKLRGLYVERAKFFDALEALKKTPAYKFGRSK